jgi:hypothetical protein
MANWVCMAASNSNSASLDENIEFERQTMYSGKFLLDILARIIVVRDFSVHSVDR